MTVRISLVRHGQTDWNVDHRLLGWTDVPLNAEGERQARRLGSAVDILDYAEVWSSDLLRAIATARLAGWEAVSDTRIREIDFGRVEGFTWDELPPELRADLAEFDDFVAPGGESVSALGHRVTDFFDGLAHGAHLVVTHGGVIRTVLRMCGEATSFPANGAVHIIDWTRKEILEIQTPTD